MTADWVPLSPELLASISNRISNEVRGVNRVVYDISSKPPAIIELGSKVSLSTFWRICPLDCIRSDSCPSQLPPNHPITPA